MDRMEHDQPDATEPGEVFDYELTSVLQAEGEMLEQHSEALLATGAVSITRPGVILHATLRLPRWRRGLLEVTAEDPVSGEVIGSSGAVLSKRGQDHESLVRELTISLALELAHGLGSAGPQ
jgi:hypothetical protein